MGNPISHPFPKWHIPALPHLGCPLFTSTTTSPLQIIDGCGRRIINHRSSPTCRARHVIRPPTEARRSTTNERKMGYNSLGRWVTVLPRALLGSWFMDSPHPLSQLPSHRGCIIFSCPFPKWHVPALLHLGCPLFSMTTTSPLPSESLMDVDAALSPATC